MNTEGGHSLAHLVHLHNHFRHVHNYFIFVVGVDKLLKEQVPVVDNLLVQNLRSRKLYSIFFSHLHGQLTWVREAKSLTAIS